METYFPPVAMATSHCMRGIEAYVATGAMWHLWIYALFLWLSVIMRSLFTCALCYWLIQCWWFLKRLMDRRLSFRCVKLALWVRTDGKWRKTLWLVTGQFLNVYYVDKRTLPCHGCLAQLDLNQMDIADVRSGLISIKHTNSSDHQIASIFNKTFCTCGLKL